MAPLPAPRAPSKTVNSGILRNKARQLKNFAVHETVGNFAVLHGLPEIADVVKVSEVVRISRRFDAPALSSIQPCWLPPFCQMKKRTAHRFIVQAADLVQ